MSLRTATSSLRNRYRKPSKLTLAATAAAAAAITSGVAVAGTVGALATAGSAHAAASTLPAAQSVLLSSGARTTALHGAGAQESAPVRSVATDLNLGAFGGHGHPGHPVAMAGPAGASGRAASGHRHVKAHNAHGGRPAAGPRQSAGRHAARGPAPCHGSHLQRWVCQAERILAAHGVPHSALNTGAGVIVAMHESGGNPRASNGCDSNAAAGTPSEGIAQVIGPTFATYHLPGHDNIWNPVDNMVAAFRYAVDRYGSMNNIPGVVAVRSGGSYVGY